MMSAVSEADHEDWAHEMRALQTRYEILLGLAVGFAATLRCGEATTPEEMKQFVENLVDNIVNSSSGQTIDKEP